MNNINNHQSGSEATSTQAIGCNCSDCRCVECRCGGDDACNCTRCEQPG